MSENKIKSIINKLEKRYKPFIDSISFNENSVTIESTDENNIGLLYNTICEELASEIKDTTFGMKKNIEENESYGAIQITFNTDKKEEAILFYLCALGVPIEYTEKLKEDIVEGHSETLSDAIDNYTESGFSKGSISIAKPNNDKFGLFK